ncbi:MAG: YecA family protein [Planctomycetota bacterium]
MPKDEYGLSAGPTHYRRGRVEDGVASFLSSDEAAMFRQVLRERAHVFLVDMFMIPSERLDAEPEDLIEAQLGEGLTSACARYQLASDVEDVLPRMAGALLEYLGALGRIPDGTRKGAFLRTFSGRLRPQPARRPAAKVGRNDPCPCGSGKKFKKCCETLGQ